MKTYIKRGVSLVLFTFILLSLFSCTGNNTPLDKLSGFWQRGEGATLGEGILSFVLEVRAEDRRVVLYSEYGIAGESYSCFAEEDTLNITVDAVGSILFKVDGDNLINPENGNVEYTRCEPIDKTERPALNGKWYRNGDTSSDYFFIDENGYSFVSAKSPYTAQHSGRWKTEESTLFTSDGIGYDSIKVKLERVSESSTYKKEFSFSLLSGGLVLYSEDNANGTYYIRESVLGTPEGERTKAEFYLLSEEWSASEFAYIKFNYYGSTAELYKRDEKEDGTYTDWKKEFLGKWHTDGTLISIEYADGEKEETPLSSDSFTLMHILLSFKRDSASDIKLPTEETTSQNSSSPYETTAKETGT